MIFFVDEDYPAFGAWLAELRTRCHDVECLWNADAAFRRLWTAEASEVGLVIIDVMLAVEDASNTRFTAARTDAYLETGLYLLEDLATQNGGVFPRRAVLLTNTINDATYRAAQRMGQKYDVPVWDKSSFDSPVDFADQVERRMKAL